MPSQLFLHGDSDPIWLAASAGQVISLMEDASARGERWLRADMTPYMLDEQSRPAYFDVARVAAVVPLDARQLQNAYEHPPDWLE